MSKLTAVDESSSGIDGIIDDSYNPRGELVGIDQTNAATGASHLSTTYANDWLGRRLTSIDPDAGEIHTSYTDNADDSSVTTRSSTRPGRSPRPPSRRTTAPVATSATPASPLE